MTRPICWCREIRFLFRPINLTVQILMQYYLEQDLDKLSENDNDVEKKTEKFYKALVSDRNRRIVIEWQSLHKKQTTLLRHRGSAFARRQGCY